MTDKQVPASARMDTFVLKADDETGKDLIIFVTNNQADRTSAMTKFMNCGASLVEPHFKVKEGDWYRAHVVMFIAVRRVDPHELAEDEWAQVKQCLATTAYTVASCGNKVSIHFKFTKIPFRKAGLQQALDKAIFEYHPNVDSLVVESKS